MIFKSIYLHIILINKLYILRVLAYVTNIKQNNITNMTNIFSIKYSSSAKEGDINVKC